GRDSGFVPFLAAALEPRIERVAVEDAMLSFLPLFDADGQDINAASMLPGMLRDFGDISDVLAKLSPRKVLAAAPRGILDRSLPSVQVIEARFTVEPKRLLDWLST